MVITSDHDDRVVPAHSFKFKNYKKNNLVTNLFLIRIETNAGHGGKSTDQIIGENTDILSFALYEMGIKELKKNKHSKPQKFLRFYF